MFGRSILRLLLLAALIASPQLARAQAAPSPDALKAAEELVALISGDMMDQMAEQAVTGSWPQIQQMLPVQIDDATKTALQVEMRTSIRAAIEDAMKGAPAIYARHLTAAELRDIAGFYATPSGKTSLRVMPVITGEVMQMLMPQMMNSQAALAGRLEAVLREHGYPK